MDQLRSSDLHHLEGPELGSTSSNHLLSSSGKSGARNVDLGTHLRLNMEKY